MEYKYYIADVFTTKPFDGAQIAVFPNASGLDKHHMQSIAREMNLSETAFVFPPGNGSSLRRMRIFSPQCEIDFAGHPIIATGFVLASIGDIVLDKKYTPLKLEQNIGVIDVNISSNNGKPVLIQFSLDTRSVIDRFVPKEDQIADLLSLYEDDIENRKFHPLMVYADQPCLVVPIKTYSAVRVAKFNYTAWSQSIAPVCMAKEVLLFSTQTDVNYSNFHARLIGPDIGIHEDPPIGSTMPAFTAYLCAQDHITLGTHTFTIDRGSIEKRKSVLNIEMDNMQEDTLSIRVGGPAVITGEGKIYLTELSH